MKFHPIVENRKGVNWYRYSAICDKCGIQFINSTFQTTEKPQFDELDLCADCLRKLLDDKTSPTYEKLKEQLYVPYEAEIKKYDSTTNEEIKLQ